MRKGKSLLTLLVLTCLASCRGPVDHWQPVPFNLRTPWSDLVPRDNPWPEYPRPAMKRQEWLNLNGIWEFSLTGKGSEPPASRDALIRVPFPVESALSGIGKSVPDTCLMWYHRNIAIPDSWQGRDILLHVEAADWETTLFVNGQLVGTHRGGYDPFSFNITPFIEAGKSQEIMLSVYDPTDSGTQPRGKQVSDPGGIFYTSSSGIWQTVWMEPVPECYIRDYRVQTCLEDSTVTLVPLIAGAQGAISWKAEVFSGGTRLAGGQSDRDRITLRIPEPKWWGPGHPFLYDLKITLFDGGNPVDSVDGYFGMRKIALGQDTAGYTRILLNDTFLLQLGLLDQGFWPDGLYTPPSGQAMRSDLERTLSMGFNMLRKHVKVESRRFYALCDSLGILVWQDMPSCGGFVGSRDPDMSVTAEHDRQFRQELERLVLGHYNHPSIILWIPFNEGWGQYDTEGIVDFIRSLDSTRLVNAASGWADRGVGDILDIHHYPDPRMPEPEADRAIVLGEYGGLGLAVEGHTWQEENWGYRRMDKPETLLSLFEEYLAKIRHFAAKGLSAAVYTQTTDVETETNGLISYDRQVVKIDPAQLALAAGGYFPPRVHDEQRIFTDQYLVNLFLPAGPAEIRYTLDGAEPGKTDSLFSGPFLISESTILVARAFYPGGQVSRPARFVLEKVPLQEGLSEGSFLPGLVRKEYTGDWESLPPFDSLVPVGMAIAGSPDTREFRGREKYGLVWEGFLLIGDPGVYAFRLTSDDGSRFLLDGQLLADNDGIHGMNTLTAYAALGKGYHPIRIEYFQRLGGQGFEFLAGKTGREPRPPGPGQLFHLEAE